MKKILSLFLCLILIITGTVINAGATDWDMDMSEYDDSGTLYSIDDIEGLYKTQGRTTVVDDVLMLEHSVSGIEFTAKCKGRVSITFNASNILTGDDGGCYFTVIIDGEKKERDFCHITENGDTVVVLATDINYGTHSFEIYRQTEISGGSVGIKNIMVDGRIVEAESDNELYIEFVGDSITAAQANIVLSSNVESGSGNKPIYQDATQGYAYLTAKALDADFSVIAKSGIGASVGWTDYTMQDMYTKLRYPTDENTEYNFAREADIVVLALGTNDMELADVKQGFKDMLSLVKQKNPNAAVIWIYNMMRSDANDLITEVIEEAGGKQNGYYALQLTRNNEGGNSHPYYTAHADYAEELTSFIEQNVFWDNRTADFGDIVGNSIREKTDYGEQGLRFKYIVNNSETDVYENIINNSYEVKEIGVLAIRTRYLNDEVLVKNGQYGEKKASAGVLYNTATGLNKISDEGIGSAVLINIGYNTKTGAVNFNAYSDDYTTRLYMVLENGDRSITVYDDEYTSSIFETMQEIVKRYNAESPAEDEQLYNDNQAVNTFLSSANVDKNNKTINELYGSYKKIDNAQTWVANELTFESSNEYVDTVYSEELDVEFFNQDTGDSFTIPAFWNGGKEWKVRFSLPTAGDWRYVTKCSDTTNTGLHYKTGSIDCTAYSGNLDIYKHGFLTTQEGKKYLTYADGTPFFYLGDTHWTLPMESLTDANGGLTDDEISALKTEYSAYDTSELGTKSQFEYIMDYRAEQGFTVIQSQQLNEYNGDRTGTGYRCAGNSWMADEDGNIYSRGVDSAMLDKFNTLDKYFEYIAELGFVHAHTQFSYPEELFWEYFHFENINDEELEKLCRYWVARYGAYPVIWTTAQEADIDYYSYHTPNAEDEEDRCLTCDVDSNPWEIVMDMIAEYDPYNHPSTAHMESTIDATGSAFDDSENHDFYAAQITKINDLYQISDASFDVIRTYFENAAAKPSIFYEGHYDHYQADSKKARAQGWMAFLNGIYGYGYGVQPIFNFYWAENIKPSIYNSYYDTDMNWVDGVYAEAADDLSFMKTFLTDTLKNTYGVNWWELMPCFNGNSYYAPATENNDQKYSVATIDKDGDGVIDVYLGYFAGQETLNLGTFKGMAKNTEYTYKWYDCATGSLEETYNFTASSSGEHGVTIDNLFSWNDSPKPGSGDMILVATKAG